MPGRRGRLAFRKAKPAPSLSEDGGCSFFDCARVALTYRRRRDAVLRELSIFGKRSSGVTGCGFSLIHRKGRRRYRPSNAAITETRTVTCMPTSQTN